LYHSMGNLKAAKKFICHSLSDVAMSAAAEEEANPIFRRPENDIFYSWSDTLCSLEAFAPESSADEVLSYGECFLRQAIGHSAEVSFTTVFQVDDDLLVGDFVLRVVTVSDNVLKCIGMINVPSGCPWQVQKKIPGNNFNKGTITNCFNLARVQEDLGHLQAARELYIELLKKHPCFIECMLKLLDD
jgi:hypothetical protein